MFGFVGKGKTAHKGDVDVDTKAKVKGDIENDVKFQKLKVIMTLTLM
jgi:hypothetical protein